MRDTKASYLKFIGIVFLLSLPLLSLVGLIVSRNMITPNDQFFILNIDDIPEISTSNWTLIVDGHVENNLNFTYSNFTSQPTQEVLATLQCVEGPYGTAIWKGVRIEDILTMAGVKPGAVDVIFYAADNYSSSLTIEQATAEDTLLAYEMNGVPLPAEHGFPVRVVAPNHWGYKWVKWIVRVEIVNYDYIGFWENRGWDDNAERVIFSEWIIHAFLFSVTLMFGGLAIISGLKPSPITESFRDLPKFVNRKFHIANSIAYFFSSVASFLYWTITTFLNLGAVFYTIHGILALGSIIFAIPAALTGIKKIKKRDSRKRTWHYRWTVASYSIFLITVIFGFLLSYTGQFRIY
jgi:hypothetical protein